MKINKRKITFAAALALTPMVAAVAGDYDGSWWSTSSNLIHYHYYQDANEEADETYTCTMAIAGESGGSTTQKYRSEAKTTFDFYNDGGGDNSWTAEA